MPRLLRPREPVAWFASEMEAKLRENDHKGGWRGCRVRELFGMLRRECDELLLEFHPLQLDTISEKLTREDACAVIRECTDVANFAMMIADNIRKKQEAKDARS